MILLPDNLQEISQIGLERIHTPFLMNVGGECFYGDTFNKYGLRGNSITFNIITQRHYSLLKNSGRLGVYSLGQGYDDFAYLMIQAFSEDVANNIGNILDAQGTPYKRAINIQRYKAFVNFILKV